VCICMMATGPYIYDTKRKTYIRKKHDELHQPDHTTIMMIHTQLSHIIVYDDDANLEFLNSSVGLLRR